MKSENAQPLSDIEKTMNFRGLQLVFLLVYLCPGRPEDFSVYFVTARHVIQEIEKRSLYSGLV